MIDKKECVSLEYVVETIGRSRQTLYTYMNALGIQRHKFPFDRKTYILKADFQRIRDFVAENTEQE